ncbi:MAG: IS3 family transposase [Planctomycetota bacterium]|nr:IS3 family transposase [Planctomycetota bacterium]
MDLSHSGLSIRQQCDLLGLARSTYYHQPATETAENLKLMRIMDEQHMKHPEFGRRMMTAWLALEGHDTNEKRIRRLMKKMGLEAIYRRPRTTIANKAHKIYPYLLRGLEVTYPNQVWCTDITYIPMASGFMYLVAIMDWYSRHVLAWQLSNTLEGSFCNETLEEALESGRPTIFNTDQGAQFTSQAFTSILEKWNIKISMDGRGRAIDNVFIERLWRTLKYDNIYIKGYETVVDLRSGLTDFFHFYNSASDYAFVLCA